jgi:hypothetical protein
MEAILGQQLLPVECPDLTQPAGIDRIGFVLPDRVLQGAEPARHERVDHGHGVACFCEGGAPVEMEHPGRFHEYEHLPRLRDLLLQHGQ